MKKIRTPSRHALGVTLNRAAIRQLLHSGHQHDYEQGGLYDARSGCVNVWCSPEDKPACWNIAIDAGGLKWPRSYVGELTWEWRDEEATEADLFIEATPYDLLDPNRSMGSYKELPNEVWEELLRWLEAKARLLLALTQAAPRIVGTACPFCAFVLPDGHVLNGLLEHIAAAHPQQAVESVVIGREATLVTASDAYPILPAHQ